MFSFFFQDGGSAMFLALCDVMMGVILKRHSLSRIGKSWSNLENFSVTRIMDGTALHN